MIDKGNQLLNQETTNKLKKLEPNRMWCEFAGELMRTKIQGKLQYETQFYEREIQR